MHTLETRQPQVSTPDRRYLLDPSVVIQASTDAVRIFHTRSGRTFTFQTPLALDVLSYFRSAERVEPPPTVSGQSRRSWQRIALQLVRAKMLVPAQKQLPSTVDRESLAEDAALVAVGAYEVGSQLPALCDFEDGDVLAAVNSQLRVVRQLLDGINALLIRSGAERVRHNRTKLSRLNQGGPLMVNLASGQRPLEGWVNVDMTDADLVQDIRWGLPFHSQSVDFLFFAHALEHFFFDQQALAVLRETKRVLKPNGVLRIVVPDIGKFMRAYVEGDSEFFALRRDVWPSEQLCRSPLEQTLWYSGASAAPHAFHSHKWGYDFETLGLLLGDAGFSRVRRCSFMGSEHVELKVDDTSEAGAVRLRDHTYSLFVEAQP